MDDDRAEVIKHFEERGEKHRHYSEDIPVNKVMLNKAIRILKEDGDVRRVLKVTGSGYRNGEIWVTRRSGD